MKKTYSTPKSTCIDLQGEDLIALSSSDMEPYNITDGGEGQNEEDGYADANVKKSLWIDLW